jgi:tetratricopeptide (TPR) repeat protein
MSGVDVYQPCLCGSGKKAKFCCASVFEVYDRLHEFESREQFEKAAQYLEGVLARGVASKEARTGLRLALVLEWMRSPRLEDNVIDGRVAAMLGELQKDAPDHPEVQALECLVLARTDQWHPSLIKLQRMLAAIEQMSYPILVSAALLHGRMLAQRGHIAAGQMLLLNLMVRSSQELNQRVAAERADILSMKGSSFAFRGVYGMRKVEGLGEAHDTAFEGARTLFSLGRYHDAAKALVPLAREHGNQPNLWWNIAICHLLCGEEPLAVRALHASVANDQDPESAAESLALARLIDPPSGDDLVENLSCVYKAENLGRVLTQLGEWPNAERQAEESEPEIHTAVTEFRLYDAAPPPPESPPGTTMPNLLGLISVLANTSGEPDAPQLVVLEALGRERLASVRADLEARVDAGLIAPLGDPTVQRAYHRDEAAYLRAVPGEIPSTNHETNQNRRNAFALEAWLSCPNGLLGGATPLEAVGKPELAVALRASVLVLATYQLSHQVLPTIDPVREQLGLPPVTPLDPTAVSLLELDPLRLMRVNPSTLDPALTERLLLTCLGLRHPAVIPLALRLAEIPSPEDETRRTRLQELALGMLREYSQFSEAHRLATQWATEAREQKRPLIERLKLHLVLLRTSVEANRPDQQELALETWQYYVPKFPELRANLIEILQNYVGDGPWSGNTAGGEPAGSVTAGGIWTPESAAAAAAPPSQGLWLPGQ